MKPVLLLAAAMSLALPSSALATETISYSYDVHGRLVQVARSGSVNHGVTTAYQHDKADNRVRKTISGSPTPPPP